MHEECDGGDNYVARNTCFECRRHEGERSEGENRDGDDEEEGGEVIELDGEHFDEDNEEPSSESGSFCFVEREWMNSCLPV